MMEASICFARSKGEGINRLLIGRVIEEIMKPQRLSMVVVVQSIYKRFGFTGIPPYRFNPVEGTSYLQLVL